MTLEKLKIHERLESVERQLVRMEATNEKIDRLYGAWFGNGTPGADKRIDRLERSEDSRKTNTRMVWTALVGLGVKAVYDGVRWMFTK